jgi:hypothetical protein
MVVMTDKEKRWCWLVGAALIVLTTLPYLAGYQSQTPEMQFSGFVIGVEDGNSYIAKMLSGSSGAWLFRSPYSAEPQEGVLAFLPYILLGKLAAGEALHAQLVGLFHLARWGGMLALVFSLYSFVSSFVDSLWWRRWVVGLSLVGGGLGWLLLLLGRSDWLDSMPLGFYSPETFGFLALLTFPHLIWARVLLLFGLTVYLQSQDLPQRAWVSGSVFALLALIQPLTVLAGYAAISGHQVFLLIQQWIETRKIVWSGWMTSGLKVLLVSSPVVIYLALAFTGDPYLVAWTAQNRILSPHPLHYLLAYGAVIGFSVYGAMFVIKDRRPRAGLIAAWIFLFPLLAYWPHNLQRRFPDGIWVALLIAAAIGLREIRPNGRRIALVILLLSLPTSGILWAGAVHTAAAAAPPAFVPDSEIESFVWLRENAPVNAIVLTPYEAGNALPAWAPVHVVIGHGPESVGLDQLRPLVDAFYQGRFSPQIKAMLERYGVVSIWYPPGIRPTQAIESELGLELVFSQSGVQIYAVHE